MKTISAAMQAHLHGQCTTLSTCWQATRQDATILRATDHDRNIIISGWTGDDAYLNGTYLARAGYRSTDVATSDALNVDNLDLEGILSAPSITEEDLRAGLWDAAQVTVFMVNWADVSMGRYCLRYGHLGEVSLKRSAFVAEQRGLMQAYSRVVGYLYTPSCRADLGDSECQVNLAGGSPIAFTVTGTITGVHPDNTTLYDTARTEPGPVGGIDILGVSNSNPGVVTTDGAHGFTVGQPVAISGVIGPASINTITVVNNPNGDEFDLSVDTSDTSDYPPYVSGGTVTRLGDESAWFDGGVITFTSGLNDGLSMEIKSYVPGQFVLHLPMPYQVQIGDTYTAVAGCDKIFATCQSKFNNAINFRGFPHLSGIDALLTAGRG